ncbi:hypothetical protein ACFL1R_11885, partial [Candidatus Latescibacterota bacterium]
PLTLSLPNVDGMEIDFQSANNTLRFISSKISAASNINNYRARGALMLRGGQIRRKFGALTLGATYASAYGVQPNREKGGTWKGTLSTFTPTPAIYAVRFLDDSPSDNEGGPVVYNVRIKVNGKYRDDILPIVIMDDVTRDRVTAITNISEKRYLDIQSSALGIAPQIESLGMTEETCKYGDYFYVKEYMSGVNSKNIEKNIDLNLMNQYYQLMEPGAKPIEVNGTKSLVYLFDLASAGEDLKRVQAVATVANDYRIQTAMVFTREAIGGHDTQGKNVGWYNSSYWVTRAQADGNIKDGSNVGTVKLDFGFQVAQIVYGFDADFNYRGFRIKGEYITNSSHYKLSGGKAGEGIQTDVSEGQAPRMGQRFSQIDHSYYITTEKNWEKFGFAGELFKMGKFYRPYLDYYYPFPDKQWGFGTISTRNSVARVALIEDNDDNDQYPDTMLLQRSMGYKLIQNEDPDGVFPGNDDDHDGLPDNNKNNNKIPDYDEPFLMFDVDPDEFVFGNDYNNNLIPDFRENDMKYDTPYDLDRQGYHIFGRYSPVTSVNLILGTSHTKGVGKSDRTNNDYFKVQMNYNVFDVGNLYAEYRYEEIQDNIHDPYIQVNKTMIEVWEMGPGKMRGRYDRALFYDELEYKNSKVNRLYLDSTIRAVPSITLQNHIRFESNEQIEGTMYDMIYQPYDKVNLIAMVNKIIYTKRWGNFVLSPGVKFRFYKRARSESVQPLDHYMMRIPMVTLKYLISPQTDITLGLQGFPGFQFQMKDYVQTQNDFKRKIYLCQIQNKTNYFGYNVWAAVGFTQDELKYDEAYRKFEEFKTSTTFIKIYLGW